MLAYLALPFSLFRRGSAQEQAEPVVGVSAETKPSHSKCGDALPGHSGSDGVTPESEPKRESAFTSAPVEDTIRRSPPSRSQSPYGSQATPPEEIFLRMGSSYCTSFSSHPGDRAFKMMDESFSSQDQLESMRSPSSQLVLYEKGHRYLRRYKRQKNGKDLNKSISLLEASLNVPSSNLLRWKARIRLVDALSERWKLRRDPTDLDGVIKLHTLALEDLPPDYPELFKDQFSLGWAFGMRWTVFHDPADLHSAIDLRTAALVNLPEGHPKRFQYQSCLGITHGERWKYLHDPADLHRAIELQTAALESLPQVCSERSQYQINLGEALRERWKLLHDPADLDRTIELCTDAVRNCTHDPLKFSRYQHNLGLTLVERWDLFHDPADLHLAIELQASALDNSPEDFPELPVYLKNLGRALAKRWKLSQDPTDLRLAVDLCTTALDSLPPGLSKRFKYQYSLGCVLKKRWTALRDPADLDRAIELFTEGFSSCSQDSETHALIRGHLASALSEQWKLQRGATDLRRAIELYLNAINETSQDSQITISTQRIFSFFFEEWWETCQDITELDRAVQLYDLMLQALPAEGRAQVTMGLASCLYRRSRLLGQEKFEGKQLQDLKRAIELFATNFDDPYLSDSKTAIQLQIFREAVFAYLAEFDTLQELDIPVCILLTLRLTGHHQHGVALDTSILQRLLSRYELSQDPSHLDQAASFCVDFCLFLKEDNPLIPTIILLVERVVNHLIDVYDNSGRPRYLEQATSLIRSFLAVLSEKHPQYSVAQAFLDKVTRRRVRVLEVSMKEPLALDGGGFSDIYRGQVDNQMVAMKVPKARHGHKQRNRWLIELNLWSRVKHRFILELLGIYVEGDDIYMISPWCSKGNCLVYIQTHADLDRLGMLCQVAEAVLYLHTFSPVIVHGDIKGENVLIDDQGNARLCDFGLSRLETLQRVGITLTPTELAAAGTYRFMAPELFAVETSVEMLTDIRPWSKSTKSDVFAFGRLILQVMTGEPPFSHIRFVGTIIAEVLKGNHPHRPPDMGDKLWDLCTSCWVQEPGARPRMEQVLERLRDIQQTTS